MPLSLEHKLEAIVYGSIFPFLIFIVVVANVFIALILSQKHMITPTNVVLRYMAIFDLCVGLVPLPWTFFFYTLRFNEHLDETQLWWCNMYKYSMDALPPFFHNSAMWLTVLLAGQRYISIEYPIQSRQLCSVKNVRLCSVVIVLISLVCGLPKFVDSTITLYDGWLLSASGKIIKLRSCMSEYTVFVNVVGPTVYFNLYFWTRVIFFILVPSILLTFLNFSLIRGIRKAEKRKQRLLKEKRAREAEKQRDSNSTSMMLVIISSIFLIVNLPQAIFMGIMCFCNTFEIELNLMNGDSRIIFMMANNMLLLITYPINFGIYCFMSSAFRQAFKSLFCSKSQKNVIVNNSSGRSKLFNTSSSNTTEGTYTKLLMPASMVSLNTDVLEINGEEKATELLVRIQNESIKDERGVETIYL
uniref:G_PROTEIN_RECEP_F1_2 domain-containing protein n=1 Tax=Rhabditophanes sp. KR3021 TaxID=114890 RepID=A0AC35U4K6_9BILA